MERMVSVKNMSINIFKVTMGARTRRGKKQNKNAMHIACGK